MPKCTKCSAPIAAGDRFCPECGTDQQARNLEGMMTIGGLETLDHTQTRNAGKEAQAELAAGTEFAGRYVIERVVGKGGMGVVYRAKDKLADKAVALKLIRAERLGGQGAVKRLISEGLTARDIRHQNIVAVYDVGDAGGQPFVSMEYLDGQSLRDWHREKIRQRQDVPLRVAARIVAEILDGLAAAHAAGVIHRDLKPENIILVSEPSETAAPLKILDFGIARVAGSSTDSGTGTGLGTPRYMAPEQVTNADSAGAPADLYSLSVIFYELLVDVLPQGHWQAPSGGRSDVPQAIDQLIETGLSNRPASRPQTAKEFRAALVNAVNLAVPGRTTRKKEDALPAFEIPKVSPSIRKWVAIGSAVFLGIILLAALIPGADGSDEVFDNGGGFEETFDNEVTSGGGTSALGALSGQWNDGLGTIYSVRVGNDGSFSGGGRNAYGYNVQLSGRFSGTNANYTLSVPDIGMSFGGSMQWDRGCHINFETRDAANNVVERGQMHVNHEPGGPCPA